MILPLRRLTRRFEEDRTESDVSGFNALLDMGSFAIKLMTMSLMAGLQPDRDGHRYRLASSIVRGKGIGDWVTALEQMLNGPAAQFFHDEMQPHLNEIRAVVGTEHWQHRAVQQLGKVVANFRPETERPGGKVGIINWCKLFVPLRNADAHGATLPKQCKDALPSLHESIELVVGNLSLFQQEWAHLRRNLSGKYRVTALSAQSSAFEHLKKTSQESHTDGVYFACRRRLFHVEFLFPEVNVANLDDSDFLVPNEKFDDRRLHFEVLSYATNSRRWENGNHFATPAIKAPKSETTAAKQLDVQGAWWGNMPAPPSDYVARYELETELKRRLEDERYNLVTLGGSGGAGKTSLALSVIWGMAKTGGGRFQAALWFSARDIDLGTQGPRVVSPDGVNLADFAKEFARLVDFKGKDHLDYFARCLQDPAACELGSVLFVFDNFETVTSPSTVFRWLETHVRGTHKILITTRTRDFKGDFPIEVGGMSRPEADALVAGVAAQLGIADLLTEDRQTTLYDESTGHPYVVKILLGEMARANRWIKPERIIADLDNILLALFERTYNALAPAARHVFLLLSSWRSVVPTVAVEAVVLRSAEERVDVRNAIDELLRLSLVEEHGAPDGETFLALPLVASLFGRKKLLASPQKLAVEADSELLQAFGAAKRGEITKGVRPRVHRLLRTIAQRIASDGGSAREYGSMLNFIGERLPQVWPDIARLYEDEDTTEGRRQAIEMYRKYIESGDRTHDAREIWWSISMIASQLGDDKAVLHAMMEFTARPDITVEELSRAANKINGILKHARDAGRTILEPSEKKAVVGSVAKRYEDVLNNLDANDLSSLAWLYLHLDEGDRAIRIVRRALEIDPYNGHCLNLARRLEI